MYIVELCEGGGEEKSVEEHISGGDQSVAVFETKRVLVGAGARALFYPTLLYNVVRNKIQSEFRWWDRVDEFILLGAVPFPADVQRLKELGVHGVVTLNEPYETLVSTSLYHAHDIKHLVIPTRDYLFAPSYGDICQAVEFIYNNASCGKTTYVHCKAGRGRSTTVVLCYLVEHKQMTPIVAYEYVRSIRPRVRLASSQWQAVQDYYQCRMERCTCTKSSPDTKLSCLEMPSLEAFDDNSMVLVSKSDIEGYEMSLNSDVACNMLTELGVACRVQLTSQAAIARLSCTWLRVHGHKLWRKKLESSVRNDKPAVSDSICKSAEFTYPCMKIGQSLVLFSLLNVSFLAFFLLKFGREMGEEGMLLLSNQEGSDEYFRSTKLALKLTCRCCLTESYCEAS